MVRLFSRKRRRAIKSRICREAAHREPLSLRAGVARLHARLDIPSVGRLDFVDLGLVGVDAFGFVYETRRTSDMSSGWSALPRSALPISTSFVRKSLGRLLVDPRLRGPGLDVLELPLVMSSRADCDRRPASRSSWPASPATTRRRRRASASGSPSCSVAGISASTLRMTLRTMPQSDANDHTAHRSHRFVIGFAFVIHDGGQKFKKYSGMLTMYFRFTVQRSTILNGSDIMNSSRFAITM